MKAFYTMIQNMHIKKRKREFGYGRVSFLGDTDPHEFVYSLLCSSLFLDILSVPAVAIET